MRVEVFQRDLDALGMLSEFALGMLVQLFKEK